LAIYKYAGLPIERFGVQNPARFEISAPPAPLANSAMMSTLTTRCQWEDEMVRERTGHSPSYTMTKKMKSPRLHTHGCPRASLRDALLLLTSLFTLSTKWMFWAYTGNLFFRTGKGLSVYSSFSPKIDLLGKMFSCTAIT